MKAYQLTANVTGDGQIESSDFRLSPSLSQGSTVQVIILVSEPEEINNELVNLDENFSEESFKKSWQQAIVGETISLSKLWEETES